MLTFNLETVVDRALGIYLTIITYAVIGGFRDLMAMRRKGHYSLFFIS